MIYPKRCKYCEHEWNARSDKPKRCPFCGARNWSEAKVREVKLVKSEWDGSLGEDYQIDYIFAAGYQDITDSHVITDMLPGINSPTEYGSDHLPVVSSIIFS